MIYCLLALLSCAFRIGAPPVATGGLRLGQVHAVSAEPGLKDALQEALAGALSARGVAPTSEAPSLEVWVVSLEVDPWSSASGTRMERAQLELQVAVQVAPPRQARLRDSQLCALPTQDTLAAAEARAACLAQLARRMAQDAVAWALSAPQEEG